MTHPNEKESASFDRITPIELSFSPVVEDAPYRWLRSLGLNPRQGQGLVQRAIGVALFAWLPIVIWAWFHNRLLGISVREPLLAHYGISVTCLVAIPLLILGEGVARRVVERTVFQFACSGLVVEGQLDRFRSILKSTARLRDHSLPWVLVLGVVAAITMTSPTSLDGLNWAAESGGRLGFGGVWFLYVARPIYIALLLGWGWRLLLVGLLCWRIARLDLSLVPTHPDRICGLGFLEVLPEAFSLWALAMSAVIMASWTHELHHHGQTLRGLHLPFLAFIAGTTLVMVAPLLAFAPRLIAFRRQALRDYGALVGLHGRLVRQRWILGERLADAEILEAPELGPIADTAAIYDAVRSTRATPVNLPALLKILVPLLIPALIGISTQIPLRQLLLKIGHALL